MDKEQWRNTTSVLTNNPSVANFSAEVEGQKYYLTIKNKHQKIINNEIAYGLSEGLELSWKSELSTRRLDVALKVDAKPHPVNAKLSRNITDIVHTIALKKQLWQHDNDVYSFNTAWEIENSLVFTIAAGRSFSLTKQRYGYIDVELGLINYQRHNPGFLLNVLWGVDINEKFQLNLGMRHRANFRNNTRTLPKNIGQLINTKLSDYHLNPRLDSIIKYDLNQLTSTLNWQYNQHLVQMGLAMNLPKKNRLYFEVLLPVAAKANKQYMVKLALEKKI